MSTATEVSPPSLLPQTSDLSPMKQFKDRVVCQRQTTVRELTRFLHTIWLFTESDIKTILVPSVLFALANALALSLLLPAAALGKGVTLPTPTEIVSRTPLITLYVWINLVVLCIQNQRNPDSVEEDRINKPTRPLPSGTVSPNEAGSLLVAFCIIAVLSSYCLGAPAESLLVIVLGYWYNDLEGAENIVMKNVLNALGIPCFSVGALQVALNPTGAATSFLTGPSAPLLLWRWILVIILAIFSTIHIQDIKDQAGDAIRNRKTVPLVLGDTMGRWLVAVPMLVWTFLLPWLWGSSLLGYAPLGLLGSAVAGRTLLYRSSVEEDKRTFKIWCLWLIALYCLPLSRALLGGSGDGLWLVTP